MKKITPKYRPSAGKIVYVYHHYRKWEKVVSSDQSCWVKTKDRRNNWPVLSGRIIETKDKHVVIGHGFLQGDLSDFFTWTGTAAEFTMIWESDAKMEPVRFDFRNAA
jgi:hypothetical protein